MNHRDVTIIGQAGVKHMALFQRDNNLDKKDNIDELPEAPAVYAICGRVNEKPVNCRFVAATGNLRKAIRSHFENSQEDGEFKNFMLSIKCKELVFLLMPDSSEQERDAASLSWKETLKPECTPELNVVY